MGESRSLTLGAGVAASTPGVEARAERAACGARRDGGNPGRRLSDPSEETLRWASTCGAEDGTDEVRRRRFDGPAA